MARESFRWDGERVAATRDFHYVPYIALEPEHVLVEPLKLGME